LIAPCFEHEHEDDLLATPAALFTFSISFFKAPDGLFYTHRKIPSVADMVLSVMQDVWKHLFWSGNERSLGLAQPALDLLSLATI
jgi:hypothetical protein